MNWLTQRLFARLPIGWLQLTHHRGRLIAAVAGIALANMLVFIELGIAEAMNGVVRTSYSLFRADIVISSDSATTLNDGTTLARRHMVRALAQPGVQAVAPLYMAQVSWKRPKLAATSLSVYALPPEATRFAGPPIAQQLHGLALPMHVLVDSLTRELEPGWIANASVDTPKPFEVDGKAVAAIGGFALGAGFGWDGSLVVSDQTFMRLFNQREPGSVSRILIDVAPGENTAVIARQLTERLSGEPVKVSTLANAIEADVVYEATQMPIGSIVSAGVLLGLLVGVVIVYQVLSTDVASHLRDYATFKAIGYSHPFILGIVFEEALVLAVLGFLPGFAAAAVIYALLAVGTDLPFSMEIGRSILVFLGTLLACTLSGAAAAHRLKSVDPAELF